MGFVVRDLAIDFRAIAGPAPLRPLVEGECGQPRGGRYVCPDCGGSATLTIKGDRFTCWSCGKKGDAIDWTAWRDGLTTAQAARQLGGLADPKDASSRIRRPRAPVAPAKPAPPAAWEDDAWQDAVDRIVRDAERALWSPGGAEARGWLFGRGLSALTLRRFRLGFVPSRYRTAPLDAIRDGDGAPRCIDVARGIVVPWLHPGSWYAARPEPDSDPGAWWVGANVRRLAPDVDGPVARPKCLALAGSSRGHGYPWPDLLPTQARGVPALVVEGEVDALLADQAVGHLVHVVTVGGAEQRPHPSAAEFLAACPVWLVATDHDEPGEKAAARFEAMAPAKARRALLPRGKDIGEFVQAGGDLAGWLLGESRRLGLGLPAALRKAPPPGQVDLVLNRGDFAADGDRRRR